MPITISAVTAPKYSAADNSTIDVEVTCAEFGVIPMTLHPQDATAYTLAADGSKLTNAQMFANAAAGQYGAVAAYVAPPAPPIAVQMWQAKAALKATAFAPSQAQSAVQATVANATNLLDAADALIAAGGNGALQAFWEYATALQSDNAMIAALGTQLGLSPAQIAALFAQAAALSF